MSSRLNKKERKHHLALAGGVCGQGFDGIPSIPPQHAIFRHVGCESPIPLAQARWAYDGAVFEVKKEIPL
jgi:hypothetical protein